MGKKLRKSSTDRIFAGVCGGIAEFFDIPAIAVRILFVLFAPSLLFYILLAIIMPEEY